MQALQPCSPMPMLPLSTLSPLALGLWRAGKAHLSREQLVMLVRTAVEVGIHSFDLANVYGNHAGEAAFGEALAASGVARNAVRLVSKAGVAAVSPARPLHRVKHYDNRASTLREAVENSLRMLRTDHLDLFLVHRPDWLLDADDLAAGLQQILRDGKVLAVGVSNFSASQVQLLASRLPAGVLAAHQFELSLLQRTAFHDGTLDLCQQLRCRPMAWSPLGGGQLFVGDTHDLQRLRTALAEVGTQLGGATPDQVALAWLMHHPTRVLPVLGTTDPERVRSAARAATLAMDHQQWYHLWQAATGQPVA